MQKNSRNCQWKIFVSHYPIVTAGFHKHSPEVTKFRRRVSALIAEYKIDLVISGHDHTSQAITIPSMRDTLFLIAGAPVTVSKRPIDDKSPLPAGAQLLWYNDDKAQVILELEMTQSKLQYKFVQLFDRGESDELMAGYKIHRCHYHHNSTRASAWNHGYTVL